MYSGVGHSTLASSSSRPTVSSHFHKDTSSLSRASSRLPELELVEDQLSGVLVNEASYQVLHIPCKAISLSIDSLPLGEEWRRKICQWAFRIIDHFRFDREIVCFGMNIFDRFLVTNCLDKQASRSDMKGNLNHIHSSLCDCPSCPESIDSRTYQLAAMTSLFIAIKLHPDISNTFTEEGTRRKRYFKLESFVELSRGQFGANDICRMEQFILESLQWKVNPPTPSALVAYLLSLMPPINDIPLASRPTYDLVLHVLQELSRYITELSVCLGSICSSSSASQIAYAAIIVSMDLLTLKALPMRARDTFHAAVTKISLRSGGTLLMPNNTKIRKLSHVLSKSLLPDMLLDEYDRESQASDSSDKKTMTAASNKDQTASTVTTSNSSSCHPIVIARDFGLLNLTRINNRTWHDKGSAGVDVETSCQPSPTGVSHGCY